MTAIIAPPAFVYWPRLRAFFLFVTSRRLEPFTTLSDWQRMCEDDYAAAMIIHKIKTEWIYSGVRQDDRGYFSDIGIVRSTRKLNRAQALSEFQTLFPKGVIKHIDDANKIITYAVSA